MTRPDSAIGDRSLPLLLSFATAFVDVVCFLGLYRTFVSFISGSVIMIGVDIAHETDAGISFNDSTVPIKVFVVLSFLGCLALWVPLVRRLRGWPWLRPALLAAEAVLLAGLTVGGWAATPFTGPEEPATLAVAFVAVLAMSLQTATLTFLQLGKVPTALSSGHLIQFVLVSLETRRSGRRGEGLARAGHAAIHMLALLGFLAGGVAGAFGFVAYGFLALACPTALVLVAALLSLRKRPLAAPGG